MPANGFAFRVDGVVLFLAFFCGAQNIAARQMIRQPVSSRSNSAASPPSSARSQLAPTTTQQLRHVRNPRYRAIVRKRCDHRYLSVYA